MSQLGATERKVEHHKQSIMRKVRLQKMLKNNPTIIMADPGLKSVSGLPAIDFMREPIVP